MLTYIYKECEYMINFLEISSDVIAIVVTLFSFLKNDLNNHFFYVKIINRRNNMYKINNFTDNDDVKILDTKGPFSIVEFQRDLSVTPETAIVAYYSAQMKVKKRQ